MTIKSLNSAENLHLLPAKKSFMNTSKFNIIRPTEIVIYRMLLLCQLKLILNHQESLCTENHNIAVRKMSRSKQLYLFNQVYPYIPFHVELQANTALTTVMY
jgi:hypothetical protein